MRKKWLKSIPLAITRGRSSIGLSAGKTPPETAGSSPAARATRDKRGSPYLWSRKAGPAGPAAARINYPAFFPKSSQHALLGTDSLIIRNVVRPHPLRGGNTKKCVKSPTHHRRADSAPARSTDKAADKGRSPTGNLGGSAERSPRFCAMGRIFIKRLLFPGERVINTRADGRTPE